MKPAKKKKSKGGGPEVPITPMLDMAFQLLTFFVLTYHPAPVEGQFAMSLLPPQPATKIDAEPPPDSATSSDLPVSLRTVTTVLRAGESGELARIVVNEVEVKDLEELSSKLKDIFNNPDLPFDQTVLQVDPKLRYEGLIQVVDIVSKYTTKISFTELDDGSSEARL